ncbi:hypothetical protein KQX54_005229 [Cotesia glomerata]|uniref:Uncharacterized protein n=1 Tax=Cotesia glomerata TaxID=32391 RepID=A0AAV7I0N3_COTGL|nr:hypothetical protein KQX54_005229 [Cotesia glomerata]
MHGNKSEKLEALGDKEQTGAGYLQESDLPWQRSPSTPIVEGDILSSSSAEQTVRIPEKEIPIQSPKSRRRRGLFAGPFRNRIVSYSVCSRLRYSPFRMSSTLP